MTILQAHMDEITTRETRLCAVLAERQLVQNHEQHK